MRCVDGSSSCEMLADVYSLYCRRVIMSMRDDERASRPSFYHPSARPHQLRGSSAAEFQMDG
jgi:hypothetical protein